MLCFLHFLVIAIRCRSLSVSSVIGPARNRSIPTQTLYRKIITSCLWSPFSSRYTDERKLPNQPQATRTGNFRIAVAMFETGGNRFYVCARLIVPTVEVGGPDSPIQSRSRIEKINIDT